MDSSDVHGLELCTYRFERAVHVFADSVACFNETMAMTSKNAVSVSAGWGVKYTEEDILDLTEKYGLTENALIKRLNT
jgi:hypothetical protein